MGSRALVGSSISSTSGSTANARAIHSLCCCPPESSNASFFKRSFSSSHMAAARSERSTISSSFAFLRTPWVRGPKATLSYTLMGKGLGFWNTIPTRLRRSEVSMLPYMSSPSSSTRPDILQPSTKSFMRFNDLRSVLLPQPEGPIKAVIFNSSMDMVTSFNA